MARLPREALLSLTARLCGELSSGEPLEISGTETALLRFAVRLCKHDALAHRVAKEWLAEHAAMQLKHVLYALITVVGATSQCSGTCDAKAPGEQVALVQRHAAMLDMKTEKCTFQITSTPSWYGQATTFEY